MRRAPGAAFVNIAEKRRDGHEKGILCGDGLVGGLCDRHYLHDYVGGAEMIDATLRAIFGLLICWPVVAWCDRQRLKPLPTTIVLTLYTIPVWMIYEYGRMAIRPYIGW